MKTPSLGRHAVAVAVVSAALLTAFLYRRAWLYGEVVFSRDILPYFLPVRHFVRASLLELGTLPRWNPYQFGGVDLIGDPTFGLLYPPNWLVLPLSPARGLTVLLALHHVIAAWGAALLLRRWGAGAAACSGAALAVAFCGYTLSVSDNILYLLGFAWTPWALWATDRLARPGPAAGGPRLSAPARVVPLALVMATQVLAGDIQGSYATGALCLAWALLAPRRGERARALALFGAAGVLAALLAAPQLLPMARVFATSARAGGVAAELADRWSLHPLRLVESVAPGFFGSTHGEQTFWGRDLVNHETGIPFVYSIYLGVPLLVAAALAWRARTQRRAVVFLSAVAALALLLALGSHTPLNGALREVLPLWGSFRYPVKSLALTIVCVALLGGLGLATLADGERPRPSARWLVLPALLTLLAGAALLWLRAGAGPFEAWSGGLATAASVDPGAPTATATRALAWACVAGLATLLVLAAHLRGHLSARAAAIALVVLVAVDLVSAGQRLIRTAPAELFEATPAIARAILDDASGNVTPPRLYRAELPPLDTAEVPDEALYLTHKWWQQDTLAPAVAQEHGIAYVLGNGVTAPMRARELWRALVPRGERALLLSGATHALVPASAASFADESRYRTLALLPEAGVRVVALRAPLPHARLVHRVRGASDDAAARALLASEDLDPAAEVVLVGREDPARSALSEPDAAATPARVVRYEPHRVEIESDGPAGVLVTADAANDDWRVEVDGAPATLLRANTYYRAVELGAGPHRVVFTHRSRAFSVGLMLFAAGALGIGLWGGTVVLSRRRARREPTEGAHPP